MRAAALVVVGLLGAVALPAVAGDAPSSTRSPNLYGETGLVRSSSARTGHLELMLGAQGFGFYSPDFLVPGVEDTNTFLGSHTTVSIGLFDAVQLSLAARAAANINQVAGTQASVGDLIPSLKLGYAFLPVAFAVDLRALLPTRENAPGFAFNDTGLTARGLITLDLKEKQKIPLRVHLNGGFTYQLGKNALGDKQKVFEQSPFFLDGASGQLAALPTQQWFYDAVDVTLAIEAPLPWATPFLEAGYTTAVGVPAERGPKDKDYDVVGDAHIILTPGVRLTPAAGFAIDMGADIGLTGNGGGLAADAAALVSGQPINPLWMARLAVSHTFDPFHEGGAPAASPSEGQITGCITDGSDLPVRGAIIEGPVLAGARIATDDKGCFTTPMLPAGDAELTVSANGVEPLQLSTEIPDGAVVTLNGKFVGAATTTASSAGGRGGKGRVQGWVTNRDDEVVEAEVEITDGRGTRALGKALAGAWEDDAAAGRVVVVAKADKYLASGTEVLLEADKKVRANVVLRTVPKKRTVTLEGNKIATGARVSFEYKTPRLQSASEFVLDELVDVLLRNTTVRIRIDAYAEGLATPDASQKLADDRALGVADYLIHRGVAPGRLDTKGVAGVDDKSRRVEFIVVP